MGKIEQRLFDLEEYLRRNDDSADSSAYLTIVGIANDVSEIESKNSKLREFAQAIAEVAYKGQMLCDGCRFFHGCYNGGKNEHEGRGCQWLLWARELGIEVEDA